MNLVLLRHPLMRLNRAQMLAMKARFVCDRFNGEPKMPGYYQLKGTSVEFWPAPDFNCVMQYAGGKYYAGVLVEESEIAGRDLRPGDEVIR